MLLGKYVTVNYSGNTGLVMEEWTNEAGVQWVRVFTEFGADLIFKTSEVTAK